MIFIIENKKYDTEKMEKIANVKKWYRISNFLTETYCKGQEVGRTYECELWRSKKGNWLLTHISDYVNVGEAITEKEAKSLLMSYDYKKYEELYNEIEEA